MKLGLRRSRTGRASKPAGTGLLEPGDMTFSSTIRMLTSTSLTDRPGSSEPLPCPSRLPDRRHTEHVLKMPGNQFSVPYPRSTGTAGAAQFRWGVTRRDTHEVTVGVPQNPVADATCPRSRPTTCVSGVLTLRSFDKWWTRPSKEAATLGYRVHLEGVLSAVSLILRDDRARGQSK